MLRTKVVLPAVALYNAWHAEGLPTLHRALVTEVAYDEEAVGEGDLSSLGDLGRQGWAALEHYGLARGNQVHPDLGRSLRLVAEAGTEYYAFFDQSDCDFTRSALVVTSGDDGLRAVLTPDRQFVLEPVKADEAAQALIAALPETRPGRGGTISIPLDAMSDQPKHSRDDAGGSFLQQTRSTVTPQAAQVAQLRKLMAEERVGGGQLFVARRDRTGRKQRCPQPLSYVDTMTGRYLSRQAPGNDGTTWMTVHPVDFGTLVNTVRQLTSTVPG